MTEFIPFRKEYDFTWVSIYDMEWIPAEKRPLRDNWPIYWDGEPLTQIIRNYFLAKGINCHVRLIGSFNLILYIEFASAEDEVLFILNKLPWTVLDPSY